MKKIYLLLLIVLPFSLAAQRDSARYYQKEVYRLYKENLDSFRNSEPFISTYSNYKRLSIKNKNYTGVMLFMDMYHSDYKQFNNMLAQEGFAPIKDIGYRLGFGFNFRSKRFLMDMTGVVSGFNNKTTKDIEKVTTNLSNLISLDFGYDVLNHSKISIYPYAGLGWRISEIKYTKHDVANPNYTSISDMISNGEHLTLTSNRLGYQLGVGFDFTISQNRQTTDRTLLFIKAGTNRPFGKDKYKYNELPQYDPGIKQADWIISVGFKFTGN